MGQLNYSDSLMNEEVSIQIVFPLLNTQRFMVASRKCSIHHLIHEIRKFDESVNVCLDAENPWIFDASGNLVDAKTCLSDFGELEWIQLFVC